MSKLVPFIFFTVMVFVVLASLGSGDSIFKKIESGVIRTITTAISLHIILTLIHSCANNVTFNITHEDILAVIIGVVIFLWLVLKWLFSSDTNNKT